MSDLARPVRQEAETASDEITEVAPGVLRLQLPLSLPGLGHVNCYALCDDQGVAIVDPGLPGPSTAAVLADRLAAAGYEPRHVHSVIITHSHIDHFGGARAFAREGARIITHRSFHNWFDLSPDGELAASDSADHDDEPTLAALGEPLELRVPWSGERLNTPLENDQAKAALAVDPDFFRAPAPTAPLDDADVVRLAGREWVAVHTPGHTVDHLCLYDPTEGVVLSGDHVLPTITPHISGVGAGTDPLTRFFGSLERMHELAGVRTVLPAHGHPFTDLDGRVDAIRDHHHERLDTLRRAIDRLGPSTVMDLSHELFRPKSWGGMAESETFAHLEHLRLAGEATRTEQGGVLYYGPARA